MQILWFQYLFASLALILPSSATKFAEHRLITSLLQTNILGVRPLINASQALTVNYRMQILSIDIDEYNQAVSILSWDSAEWIDQLLTWNPEEHSEIHQTYLKENMIWKPDISLFNIADEPESKYNNAYASVMSNGKVTWTRTAKHKSPCRFDSAHFPFDTHICEMSFGSTIYDGYKIDLKLGGVSLSSYSPNVRWWMKNAEAERIVSYYPCCPEPYITLVFRFTLQRHATYYIYSLLVPTFLLSLFTLILYLLPYHRLEKITVGIILFGAFFVLLMVMQSIVPISDTIPYFMLYLCFNLVLIALSVFFNSIIINMASEDNIREVPKALRSIIEVFARLLCMSSIVRKFQSRHLINADFGIPPVANNYYTLPLQDKKQQNNETAERDSLCDEDQPESVSHRFVDQRRFESNVAAIRTFTSRYQEKLADEEGQKRQLSEWRDVARVTNRLFFLLCFFVDIGTIGAYLFLAIWPL